MSVPEPGAGGPRWRPAVARILTRILREPLLHFALIGATVFAVAGWREGDFGGPQEIVITEGDLRQMLIAWRAQGLPEPTPAAFRQMLEIKVREEVLYREALAMGLDKEDVIVKRRMAQKMDFLAEDLSALHEPTRQELAAYFAAHEAEFAIPPRISFRHAYFSPDTHGNGAEAAAEAALAAGDVTAGASRFMFQDVYRQSAPDDVARVFGPDFAGAVFGLAPGAWSGPVQSGYGWHLVHVDAMVPGRVPELEEVEEEVREAWTAARREEFKAVAYEAMREKYRVVLPELDGTLDAEGS